MDLPLWVWLASIGGLSGIVVPDLGCFSPQTPQSAYRQRQSGLELERRLGRAVSYLLLLLFSQWRGKRRCRRPSQNSVKA